jgi:uncharacterized phage protein (TIGR02218 family)
MAVSTYEKSAFSGRPLQLYRFLRSSGGTDFYWRYNGSDRDLTYLSNLYAAVSISDGGIKLTGEAAASEFKITLPAVSQLCDDFRGSGSAPSDTIYAHVFRAHVDDISGLDTDVPTVESAALVWAGTVDGLTQITDTEMQITCSTLAASFKRGGLRYTWQKNCPHVLYNPLTCKADKTAFRVDATVDTAYGNIITSSELAAFADSWFLGGYIEYMLPSGFIETRLINRHIGASIRVLAPVVGVAPGDPLVVYPGCKRTVRACIDKFDNYDNYGGFPHIPGRSPFDGNPVF